MGTFEDEEYDEEGASTSLDAQSDDEGMDPTGQDTVRFEIDDSSGEARRSVNAFEADMDRNAVGGGPQVPQPRIGSMTYVGVVCLPCLGIAGLRQAQKMGGLWRGNDFTAVNNAKKTANHLGFVATVFGTLMWMVVYGLVVKPLIASEPPCDNYPDCVPETWLSTLYPDRDV